VSRSNLLTSPEIRAPSISDREEIQAITVRSGGFRPEEVAVAMDVFDAALGIGRRADPDYEIALAELDGRLVGWACWGPTPCTVGTFDLYWIVVDGSSQSKGIGTLLIEEMEHRIADRARLIVVETAGRDDYAGTRRFYQRRGYEPESRIADYYGPGDDLVVYVKRPEPRASTPGPRTA